MKCDHNDSRIINSRYHNSVDKVRRHECKVCKTRWTTVEIVVRDTVVGIKRDMVCDYLSISEHQMEAVQLLIKTLRQM